MKLKYMSGGPEKREASYEKMIGMPHHISKKHPQMKPEDRAAQFSPFAALSGYNDTIEETTKEEIRKVEKENEGVAFFDGWV